MANVCGRGVAESNTILRRTESSVETFHSNESVDRTRYLLTDLSAEAQRILIDEGIVGYINGRGPKIGRMFLHGSAENVGAVYNKLKMRSEMGKIEVKVGEPGVSTRGIDGLYWNLDVDDLVRLYAKGVLNSKNYALGAKR